MGHHPPYVTATVTISSGNQASAVVDTLHYRYMTIITPSALDATSFTFQVSDAADGTFVDVYSDSTQVSTAAAASRGIIGPDLGAWRFIKVVSNAVGGETADRDLVLLLSGDGC